MDEEHYIESVMRHEIDQTCALCAPKKRNRIKEFLIDPGSECFSMSRLCLAVMVVIAAATTLAMTWYSAWAPAAAICTGTVASISAIYYGSTRKRYVCNGVERVEEIGK